MEENKVAAWEPHFYWSYEWQPITPCLECGQAKSNRVHDHFEILRFDERKGSTHD